MKINFDEHDYSKYAFEMERIERVMQCFDQLADIEKKQQKKIRAAGSRYLRKIHETGSITAIGPDAIEWLSNSNERITLVASEEICQELYLGDELILEIGLRNEEWRVIGIHGMANFFGATRSFNFDEQELPELLN